MFAKRKPGYLSYAEDPKGFRSILSRYFPKSNSEYTSSSTSNKEGGKVGAMEEQQLKEQFIQSFSADPNVLGFSQYFCNSFTSSLSKEFNTLSSSILYHCLTNESPELISVYMYVLSGIQNVHFASSSRSPHIKNNLLDFIFNFWNMKMMLNYSLLSNHPSSPSSLLHLSFFESVKCFWESLFDSLQFSEKYLKEYLLSHSLPSTPSHSLSILFICYLIYYDIPIPSKSLFLSADSPVSLQQLVDIVPNPKSVYPIYAAFNQH